MPPRMKPTQDFWEKVTLLAVTALLTGLLIPFILKSIDESRALEQRKNEAERSRQLKLIDAQAKFLEDLTEALWQWRYLSMKVVYSGEPAEHAAAVKEYRVNIWNNLNRFRTLATKARGLVSERGHQDLLKLYETIVAYDARLDALVSGNTSGSARAAALSPMHGELRDRMTNEIDRVLDLVARETRLSALVSPPAAAPPK